jgi:hypothetical protein
MGTKVIGLAVSKKRFASHDEIPASNKELPTKNSRLIVYATLTVDE